MTKTFVSYHHGNDQQYKEALVSWAANAGLITDLSVGVGDIEESNDHQGIRRRIRDNYLRDSEVTILLCGIHTRFRKHVDWEIKSSMINGSVNSQSGILVIDLPTSRSNTWITQYPAEKDIVYPEYSGTWGPIGGSGELKEQFPDLPRRILENLVKPEVSISIVPWNRVYGYADRLQYLLEQTAKSGRTNRYDLGRPMRMKNFNPAYDAYDVRT